MREREPPSGGHSRRCIRHPAHMPIRFVLHGDRAPVEERLRNVGEGGLCFASTRPVDAGLGIRLEIPVFGRRFEIEGSVAWCRAVGSGFEVGVAFAERQDRFAVRLVEQLVYIEDYRMQVEREEGRRLTGGAAAAEWIERFAGDFPDLG